MNRTVKDFYDHLGINVIDIIEKGKQHPWRLFPNQIEYAMDEVRLLILDEVRNGETYHGPIPRRIFERARKVKAHQYQMLTTRIEGFQKRIERLELQRKILIATSAAIAVGSAVVYGVLFI